MIWFRNLNELETIADDLGLWRELFSFMLFCRAEFLETEDEADLLEHDFAFAVATAQDLETVRASGVPEEFMVTHLHNGYSIRRIVRLVFPAEVIFYEAEPGDDPASLFLR